MDATTRYPRREIGKDLHDIRITTQVGTLDIDEFDNGIRIRFYDKRYDEMIIVPRSANSILIQSRHNE